MFGEASLLLVAKLVRSKLRRAKAALEHGSLADSPVFFANSFPKSGTHLLIQVLKGFVYLGPAVDSGLPAIVTFDGPSGVQRPVTTIMKELFRLRPGDIAYGHLHAVPELVEYFKQDPMVPYFIYRDPRDVVVSHVYYVTHLEPDHIHHAYYKNELNDFDDRLLVSILGRPKLTVPFPDIASRYAPYLSWLDIPAVLSLRYEDFIMDRDTVLLKIIDHAVNKGFQLRFSREDAAALLKAAINPQKSPTFRSGKVGGWRDHFTQRHIDSFKEVCGDLLIRLGYEADDHW